MITCMYDGRIGNNIFQISSVMGMAIANKLECGFEKWRYAHHFKNQLPELKRQTYYKVYEKNFHYNQYDIPDYNYELCGFFQSWKYFAHCEDVIRKQFEFSDAVKSKVKEKYGKIDKKTVAVHIRRGDYVKLADYHFNLPVDYYKKAMDEFDAHQFFVFSDEPAWCKAQDFGRQNITFIEGNDEGMDMCLMSQCSNFIIANSSFSWWGAWLSKSKNKKVIAPLKWFAKAKMNKQTHDLIPEAWKKM